MNIETYQELEAKITQWATDRGIIQNSTPLAQAIKTAEETAELLLALSKGNAFEAADAYGDILVTLIIGARIAGIDIMSNMDWLEAEQSNAHSTPMKKAISTMESVTFLLSDLEQGYMTSAQQAYVAVFSEIMDGSRLAGLDLLTCLQGAYNIIKDRKGFLTPDGIFVKEV